jgi:hypothetical protein
LKSVPQPPGTVVSSFFRASPLNAGFDFHASAVDGSFDDFSFEYEQGKFTSVDDKEVVSKDGVKSTKRVTGPL